MFTDSHTHLGIISEPEMTEHKITASDKFIVLATDGIWDYLSNIEVVKTVHKHGDPLKAAKGTLNSRSSY